MAPKKKQYQAVMTFRTIKSMVTRELNAAQGLIATIERILESKDSSNLTVLDGYRHESSQQLRVLDQLPAKAERMLMASPNLCSQDVLEKNREELANHFAIRGYVPVRESVIGIMNNLHSAIRTTKASDPEADTTPEPSSDERLHSANSTPVQAHHGTSVTSSDTNSNNHVPLSQQQVMEFMASFSKRFECLENVLFDLVSEKTRNREDNGRSMAHGTPTAVASPANNATSPEVAPEQPVPINTVASVEHPAPPPSPVNTVVHAPIQQENSSLMYTNLINSILLTIPPFDGKPEEYAVFKQQFDMLVHEKKEIPDSLKHVLLLKLLTGDLKDRMRSTNISTRDYETLRSNLERQFNRDKDNKQIYLEQLKTFVFDEHDFDKMQADLDKFCIIINNLKNVGCATDDILFIDNFINKLPSIIMDTVYKRNRQKERTLAELIDITYDVITEKRALEKAKAAKKSTIQTSEVYTLQANPPQQTKGANGKSRQNQNKWFCGYCQSKEHSPFHCALTIQQKVKAVEDRKLCNNCLRTNHIAKNCRSNRSCRHCQQKHHTAHCTMNTTQKPIDNEKDKSAVEVVSKPLNSSMHMSSDSYSNKGSPGTTTAECIKNSSSLEKTTTIITDQFHRFDKSPDIGPKVPEDSSFNINVSRGIESDSKLPFLKIRTPQGQSLLALVDCGASSSIISTHSANKLQLPVIGTQPMTFSGFVAKSEEQPCKFYQLEVLDHENNSWSTAIASYHNMQIPFCAPNLSSSEIEALQSLGVNTQSIKDLQQHNGQFIDVILGNNILGHIGQKMSTLPSGRMVTRTILGTIVYPPISAGGLVPSNKTKPVVVSDYQKHIAVHTIDTPDFYLPKTTPNDGATPDNIVMYRFTRLPFGVNCSPFLLAITILQYLEIDPNPINQKIVENLYVDNVIMTSNDQEEILSYYNQLKLSFGKMHMNIRDFQVNSSEVMDHIPPQDRSPNNVNKVLGHLWNGADDTLTIKLPSPPPGVPTKRQIVAFLAKIYDPTGIVTPIGIQTKQLVSCLWEHKLKWSDPIPESLLTLWSSIANQFTSTSYTVPPTNAAINLQKELHIKISKVFFFSDSTCTLYWVLHKVSSHIGLKWARI
ncbi:hypothetical protein CAEBREN_04357 [Caenorhabditis brenneri]|uniref:Peptidase A2 domain-containing protein n=1 Tax=Caenorhabditis brenneri TaxID=135651 RepID=G0MR85_CAEBE|nr:hypothetical protein CAEBREN_04357 [Caenorhabditis brenneri]